MLCYVAETLSLLKEVSGAFFNKRTPTYYNNIMSYIQKDLIPYQLGPAVGTAVSTGDKI